MNLLTLDITWLNMRRERRYRRGYLQAMVTHGVITHDEWKTLSAQVNRGEDLRLERVANYRAEARP